MKDVLVYNKQKGTVKIMVSFAVLFLCYHLAEYFILFRNNPSGFFAFQLAFFALALFFGNWYASNGLAAWGLRFKFNFRHILAGLFLGVAIYAVPYFVSVLLRLQEITAVPDMFAIFQMSLPFAFGVLFSSFSEDILTRGLIFGHFRNRLSPALLVLFSSVIYVLNHIYRWGDGPETWLYLFLLGIILMIPLLHTKSLWITGIMHWAGNVFFFVSHNVVSLEESETAFISQNYLFSICLLLSIPVVWIVSKKLDDKDKKV